MTGRRNEVDVIAGLRAASRTLGAGIVLLERAPSTLAFLQVPLTPSRAAALAAFTARTGMTAQALVLDLIDDFVFDTGLLRQGDVPCVKPYRSASRAPPKSTDASVGSRQDCRGDGSDPSQSSSGRTRLPQLLPQLLSATSAPPSDGSPASSSHPQSSSQRSSSKSQDGCE